MDDVELANTGTQTEVTTRSENVEVADDSSKRIRELENALKAAKAAEGAARAEVMRKDVELSRAAINAQKRAANDEKLAREAKKSKLSEENVSFDNLEPEDLEPSHHTPSGATQEGAVREETSEAKLSVNEMLQDFSDKLNSNLLPSNFTADSDSE